MEQYILAAREGLRNFIRARTLSLALIGCMAVAVFVIGAFGLLTRNVSSLLSRWESRVELVAFLSYDLSEQETEKILERILSSPQVEEARLVTGRQSWNEFFAESAATTGLKDISIEDVLPPSVIIRPAAGSRKPEAVGAIASHVVSIDGVDEVKFEESLLEKYMQFRDELAVLAVGTSIFLLLAFGTITANIAGLASAARRSEVSALCTLGASRRFVRRMFMVEGVAQGFAGSLVGIIILWVASVFLYNRTGGAMILAPRVFVAASVVGPVLGLLSSWFLLRNALTIAFVILLAVIPSRALAQSGGLLEKEIVQRGSELEELEAKLKQSRGAAKKISKIELDIMDELERLDRERESLSKRIESSERNIASNREAVEEVRTQLSRCEIELSESKREMGQWLRLLYNQREPTFVEVILSDMPHSEITRKREMISRLAEKEADVIERTERLYAEYSDRQEELKNRLELDVLYAREIKLQAQQSEKKKKERETLLARLRQQENIYDALIKDLEASAQELQSMMEKHREEQEAVFAGSVPFRDMKGLLPRPVDGEITVPYGRIRNPDSPTYTRHLGLDFAAPEGSEIKAVHDASVLYCDWFRGYGKLVILDHGGGYNSVYGHCSDILVQKGNLVRAGQPIAFVGETGSLKGPFLYFEIREQGMPVDPALWLQGGK